MTRYSWMIHTADEGGDEPLGNVYLSLHGLRASTQELDLPRRDFAGDTVESGIIEVRSDLGELQSCSLRTQDSQRGTWAPDWIRVTNLSDGRQWSAQGSACEADGSCPLMRFKQARGPVELPDSKDAQDQNADEGEGEEPKEDPAGEDQRGEVEESKSSDGSADKDPLSIVRTYEIFGRHKGRVVPLAEILQVRAGQRQLTPGAQVLLTDQESQGFGLGGEPGLWEDLYPSVDPALYGLDSDKPILASDGSRGWVVDAHYLAMIFGVNWRRVVYGN